VGEVGLVLYLPEGVQETNGNPWGSRGGCCIYVESWQQFRACL